VSAAAKIVQQGALLSTLPQTQFLEEVLPLLPLVRRKALVEKVSNRVNGEKGSTHVDHNPQSLALHRNGRNVKTTYSSDTIFDPEWFCLVPDTRAIESPHVGVPPQLQQQITLEQPSH